MNKQTRVAMTMIALLALAALPSCRKSNETANTNKVQPVDVRVEVVKPVRLVDAIQVAGTVKAIEDVNISPVEGGVVKAWRLKKGDRVAKGDIIVLLDDDVIKAGLDAAEAQFKMAQLNVEKQQKVFEEQGISELQYKNLQYGRDAAKANLDLMRARWEHTRIKSPIGGIVENTIPNEGEMAPPGMPIARVVNTSVIKIQAEIPEMYSGSIPHGASAIITFDALPDDTLNGRVSFTGSTISTANRTLLIEIAANNPFRNLKPEMVAKVKLLRETRANALLVSENIVQLVDRDRSIVYVENGGKAEERRLTLGGRQGNMVEVVDGLKAGDHLIVVGYQKLVNGTPVVVTQ